MLWSGAVNNIPEGFALCDGTNGTPDLRNRFVVGAGDTYSVGDTGGSNSVTLTINQMPSHAHVWTNTYGNENANYAHVAQGSLATSDGSFTTYVGGNQPHENRPPYYALCYIMKVA